MSLSILQDNNLNIKVNLFKKVRFTDNKARTIKDQLESVMPIDVGSIVDLTIEDSLLAHGMQGTISINNKFNILDQLHLTANNGDDLYLSVSIVDTELQEAGLEPYNTEVAFLGYVQNAASASANIEDNIVVLEFEEYFISELKRTDWGTFQTATNFNTSYTHVIDLMKAFEGYIGCKDVVIVDSNVNPTKMNLKVNEIRTDDKVYDVFCRALRKTTTVTSGHRLPVFRFVNQPGLNVEGAVRQMYFTNYLTDKHRGFLKDVKSNEVVNEFGESYLKDSVDYSDVYTEKFSIGPFAAIGSLKDKNTNLQNTIEAHNIVKPNIGELRRKQWGNYKLFNIKAGDPANVKIFWMLYAVMVSNFIDKELGGQSVNLPLLDPKTQTAQNMFRKGDVAHSNRTQVNEVYYNTTSSFMTVNEQIHFTVKGKVYRSPGKFIWVDRTEREDPLHKLWFVNSITHKIQNGKYTTDIVATRVFGDKTLNDFKILIDEAVEVCKKLPNNGIGDFD